MARYLVSGAAGFIGSNLVLALEEQGNEIVAVDSLRTGSPANLEGFKGRFHKIDVAENEPLPSGKWDAVFHLGDITDPRHGDDAEVLRKNVGGFSKMLAAAQQSSCRFIYASTAGLYGNGPTPMREDQDKEILTAYGRSKQEMDWLAEKAGRELPVIGLRYFNVFGPREAAKGRAASMVYHLYQQVRQGKRPRLFEWGEQKRDFIYVKDAVLANQCALTAPSGVYNVGTGTATSFKELAASLGRAMDRDTAPEYFPSPYDTATYQADTQADTKLASERLGFTAQWSFDNAVRDYVQWMDKQT
ncbi:NAD-dependent epimerase/dehydratase family protein [bacterium]|nr:NAD-dependent epimerase/dehydratase family protein [bacterium]